MGTRARKFGRRYPWLTWFRQEQFTLYRGQHFDCRVHGMAQMIRNAASSAKIRRRVSLKVGDNYVQVKVGESL